MSVCTSRKLRFERTALAKAEICEAADERFGLVERMGVRWDWDDGVVAFQGMGADVGVEDVFWAASDNPGGVVVATQAFEGDFGAHKADVVDEKTDVVNSSADFEGGRKVRNGYAEVRSKK